MFAEKIEKPVYPITEQYIKMLCKPAGEPGLELTMLGIGCFKRRVKDYKGILGKISQGYSRKTDAILSFLPNWKETWNEQEGIHFYLYTYSEKNDVSAEDERLSEAGFEHKKTVEGILKEKFQDFNVDVWYHTKKNCVFILTNRFTMPFYHLILSFLPLYYPNVYKTPITKADPEVKTLSALSKTTSSLFVSSLSNLVEEFREEFIRVQLAGLIAQFKDKKIKNAEAELAQAKNIMEDFLGRYTRAVENFREAIIKMEGIKASTQETEQEKELIEYLTMNKEVRTISVRDSTIYFTVATLLKQFSTDAWDTFTRNGVIYDGYYKVNLSGSVFENKENRKLLLNSIFSEDAKFEVKMAGNYYLNIYNNSFGTSETYDYIKADPIYKDYVPNPHLKLFGCLGQYHGRVVQRLGAGDLVTALEMCCYSAGSVDLDETEQTFRPFIGWILSSKNKILRRNDGVDVTPEEALIWLLDQKGKDNEAD